MSAASRTFAKDRFFVNPPTGHFGWWEVCDREFSNKPAGSDIPNQAIATFYEKSIPNAGARAKELADELNRGL